MMNSIGLTQEMRQRRQIQLSLPRIQPMDTYKATSLRLTELQNRLLSSGSRASSSSSSFTSTPFPGADLFCLRTSPLSLLPQVTRNDDQQQGADLLMVLNSRKQLLSSSPPTQASVATVNSLQTIALLSKLNQLGATLRELRSAPTSSVGSCTIPGRVEPFPEKLHRLLVEVERVGRTDIISFIDDDAFRIHDQVSRLFPFVVHTARPLDDCHLTLASFQETFSRNIVPKYFRQTKLTSFKRQLKLYGFELISHGPSKGGYRHNLFSKKEPEKCRSMKRVAVKTPKSMSLPYSSNSSNVQGDDTQEKKVERV